MKFNCNCHGWDNLYNLGDFMKRDIHVAFFLHYLAFDLGLFLTEGLYLLSFYQSRFFIYL